MADLDLSFAETESKPPNRRPPSATADLDLSFVDGPEFGKSQPPADAARGLRGNISDVFTGADRETAATRGLPEFDMPLELPTFAGNPNVRRQASAALGLLTTFDPKGQVNILATNFPKLKFSQDEKGNIIVDGREGGGVNGFAITQLFGEQWRVIEASICVQWSQNGGSFSFQRSACRSSVAW